MKDDIIVIPNVIPKDYQNYILSQVTSLKFPWFFNPTMVSDREQLTGEMGNITGFNHFLFEEDKAVSNFFETIYPITLSITDKAPEVKFQKVERARFNLTFQNKTDPQDWHLPHIDSPFPHLVAIYYVNDSDGDTVIFNETNDSFKAGDFVKMKSKDFTVKKRITPEKGKMVIFPGQYYHASSSARDSKTRIVLNMNLGNIF
jgi:Putative 2OG-Fe(II) oxygenase